MTNGKTQLIVAGVITLAVLVLYLSLLSSKFNGDGLGYARIVEDAEATKLFSVSARLLFCPTGRLAYNAVQLFDSSVRSVHVLQIMNAVFGAIGAGVFFLTAFSVSRNRTLSILVTLGLSFSLSYWFWCTNATSYPANVLFLILTLHLLVRLSQVSEARRYLALSFLIGLTFALANLYWLAALILAPPVAIGVLIAGRWTAGATRVKGAIVFTISFLLFLFIPLLIAGLTTGRVNSASDFPEWLTAASYGIPPELSLLNLSRGVIGFSSSMLSITEFGPAVKQAIWGVPYAVENQVKLYVEIGAFTLLWVFLAILALYIALYRRELFRPRPRLAWILALWAAPPVVFGLTWLGSDTERWLSILPVLWLIILFAAVHAERYLSASRARAFKAALCIFVTIVFAQNLTVSVIPDSDIENNEYMRSARFLNSQMSSNDLALIWGHDQVFTADHLRYFFRIDALHLEQIAREQPDQAFSVMNLAIRNCFERDGRVFVSERVFLDEDLPESHRSEKDANIKRTAFKEYFSAYDVKDGFVRNGNAYRELAED